VAEEAVKAWRVGDGCGGGIGGIQPKWKTRSITKIVLCAPLAALGLIRWATGSNTR
jgi:hypothetical protein